MPREELPPDPDALKAWENLPKNAPSRKAMPPATGGTRFVWGFLAVLALIVAIAFLIQWIQ